MCIIGESWRGGVEKFDSNLRTADALRSSGEFFNFDNLACTLWRVLRQLCFKSKHMDELMVVGRLWPIGEGSTPCHSANE